MNGWGSSIVEDAPLLYPSTIPVDWLVRQIERKRSSLWEGLSPPNLLEVQASKDAGHYLCNYLFFLTMHLFRFKVPFCGFIHLPPIPNEPLNSSYSEKDIVYSLFTILKELTAWKRNLRPF